MNEFGFDNDRNEKIDFIKKLSIIVFVFIIVFLIVRGCNNFLSNKIREDINKDKIGKIEKEASDEIDLNKPFSYYNIKNEIELDIFIERIAKYLKPKELQKYIDYSLYEYKYIKDSWNKIDNLYEILNKLPKGTYANLLEQLLYNKVNYDEAPLTEYFKEKFDSAKGILYDYGLEIGSQEFKWVGYDYEKKYFVVETNKGDEIIENIDKWYIYSQDYHYFNFVLDEEGYLDDIVFDHIKHMTDEFGEKIPEIDKYLMNDEEVVKEVIKWLCTPVEYGRKTAPVDDWYHAYNEDLEYGFTDGFRAYTKGVWNNGDWYHGVVPTGILPYEDYESFNIESIDMDNKIAVIKVELEDKYVYYDISWTTDENYRLDTIEAKFNREELK